MSEEFFFTKLCWVCLAEQSNMSSLLDRNRITVDSVHPSVLLCDVLNDIVQSEIFFINGPYLICDTCKNKALAAYKFKKRCEVSLNIFKKYDLDICKRQHLENRYNVNDKLPVTKIEVITIVDTVSELLNTKTPNQDEIDSILDKVNIEESAKSKEDDEHHMDTIINELQNDKQIEIWSDEVETISAIPTTVKVKKSRSSRALCTICGLEKSRNGMKQHLLMHKNLKSHACPHCSKKFNDKGNLKVHIRIHTGFHPYSCDVCNKKFIQSSGLKSHKRIHDNSKPFMCHLCSYSTRTSSHLQLHIKRHNGIKNYHCEQCNYSACSKAELTYHLAKHSTAISHICKICGKGFTRYKALKTHENGHSGTKRHICQLCRRGFTQAHSLRTHLKTIHKKLNEVVPK